MKVENDTKPHIFPSHTDDSLNEQLQYVWKRAWIPNNEHFRCVFMQIEANQLKLIMWIYQEKNRDRKNQSKMLRETCDESHNQHK